MRIPRPVSLIPRLLWGTAVLAAVFGSGWYLGQPLMPAICESPAAGPHEFREPLRFSEHFEAELVSCEPADYEPRILAWLTGDLR